ncbi:MAG: phosphoribosylaminoimidazolesuccinocarboxamide synthase [Candidatus Liptonbacteria bacterium]|nr:phosphoribosylaminoimidazolesuccinocarboxamide synthase [Candidatus Liptonbacteria bacterium]
MDREAIAAHLDFVLKETNFPELGARRQGKVRDVYDQGDTLVLIATDRYSAFDRNLALIPFKGQTLTAIASFWFEQTKDIIQNHLIASPDPNVVVARKCTTLPVEVVPRAYITGVTGTSLWTKYQAGERDFGNFKLPEGLKKNQKLERTVLTPTTKSDVHDEQITPQQIVERGIIKKELWEEIERVSLALFARGQEVAAAHGLILVDTKYEFGLDAEGRLTLIDEIHTPDSSRYWQLGSYEERFAKGEEPEYFDKEFLRLWFKANSDPYKDKVLPEVPKDKVAELSSRYVRIYEQLLGKPFEADFTMPILERIAKNIQSLKQ